MVKILLDAGHDGKYNQSPVNKEYYESEFNWDMVQRVKRILLDTYEGVQVGTTRSTIKTKLDVYERGTKGKGYDFLLSFHSNATTNETVDRAVVIHQLTASAKEKVFALDLANAIKKQVPLKDNSQIYSKESTLTKGREYYGILRGARDVKCSAFIVEHGFHTNKNCTNQLMKSDVRNKLAIAECEVIANYFNLKKKKQETKVKVLKELPIRQTPSNDGKQVATCPIGVYTIVERSGKWGKLKSGLGWVSCKTGNVQEL